MELSDNERSTIVRMEMDKAHNTMNKNQYVLTTRFVIYDNSEIIRIIHEENGDWQFLGCEDNLKESDAVVVSLGEMMDFDNTLSVVDSLPVGKQALRTNKQHHGIFMT